MDVIKQIVWFPKAVRILLLWLALCLPLTCFLPQARAQQTGSDPFEDTYELVLQVQRKQEVITNSLLAFQRGYDGYYLPVKGLADILGLYVNLDLEAGTATGWYLKPGQDYEINATNKTYILRGELVDFAPDDIFIKDFGSGFGDIYVRLEVLNEIWPLEMEIDFSTLKMDVNTASKLPYEQKRDRLKQRENLLARQAGENFDLTGYKNIENPYRFYSPPVVDISTSSRWEQETGNIDNRTNFSGKSDLLGFSADYNLNLQYLDHKFVSPEDLRMTLTRRSFGTDSMPLGIREVTLGDTALRAPDLTVSSNGGRGAYISSRPIKRTGTFDEIVVEGSAIPGWEIELYRNSELLDFGVVQDTGYYRFENVQLLAGSNRIKVILYGPEGQVEEIVETHEIGGGLLSPGHVEYEAGIIDTSNNLISFKKDHADDFSVTRANQNNEEDTLAYNASARVGVNRWMSLFATGTKAITRQGGEKYVTGGAELSLGQAHANVEAYKQTNGGFALDTRFATSFLGWRINLRNQYMNNFESDKVGFDESARILSTRGSLSNRFTTEIGQVGITASAEYEKSKNQHTTSRYQINNTLSQRHRNFGNRIAISESNQELSRVDGLANAAFRLKKNVNMRGLLNYNIKPHFFFDGLNANLDYKYSDKLTAGLDATHSLQTAKSGLGANVSYDFGSFLGSLSTNWHEDNGVNITLRASTSLAPFGEDNSYIISSRSLRGQNAVNANVYLDRNLNEIYDEGDSPVEGASLLLDTRPFIEDSDENGFVSEIANSQNDYTRLRFQENSTDNPFHASSLEGYRLWLRSGVSQHIDFALVETGIVDGTAYFDNGNPVPGLKLQLLDRMGTVVKETITGFDGFYTFEFVKPGQYAIRPDPLLDIIVPTKLVSVSQDAPFAYGLNVKLLDKAGLPPSPVQVDPDKAQRNIGSVIGALARLQDTLKNAADADGS